MDNRNTWKPSSRSGSLLTLDENHVYRWDGEVVPGVNEILGDMGIIDTSFMTDEGAANGKRRHLLMELYDNEVLDWSTVDESDMSYLVGWQEFLTDTGFKADCIEEQVYNEFWHYAGTLDRAGRIEDQAWIIDIKTGGIGAYVPLQLSLYAAAHPTWDEKYPPRLGIVHLRKGAKKQYAFKEVEYTKDALAIVAAWQWANKKRAWIGGRNGENSPTGQDSAETKGT